MLRRPVYSVKRPVVQRVVRSVARPPIPRRNYCVPSYGPPELYIALAFIVIPAIALSCDSDKKETIERAKAKERKILEKAEEILAVEAKCVELRKKRIS